MQFFMGFRGPKAHPNRPGGLSYMVTGNSWKNGRRIYPRLRDVSSDDVELPLNRE
jgi:hypothetical protein